MLRLLVLASIASGSLLAQTAPSNFVLDQSRPFAYLKLDHIGPRKPAQSGEGSTGIWLRVVNNCRIPIVLRASGAPEGEPGVTLEDEVVPNEPMLQMITSDPPPEISAYSQEINSSEREAPARQQALTHMPSGYEFEVSGVVRVEPGKDVLFSVPANHVSPDWYMRVKFALAVDRSSIAIGPFTYLEFHSYDIPKK